MLTRLDWKHGELEQIAFDALKWRTSIGMGTFDALKWRTSVGMGIIPADLIFGRLASMPKVAPARERRCVMCKGEVHFPECRFSGVWVIVDLDGTLSDSTHRLHLAKERKWEQFHAASRDDPVYMGVKLLLDAFVGAGLRVAVCTGRRSKWRAQTILWLQEKEVPFHELLMASTLDHRSDHVIKLELMNDDRAVLCVLDDRETVVDAWRAAGYLCLQPQRGAY